MSENPLPLEYLVTSSQSAVESFELSRLNRVSNLRKEIRQIVDEWIAAEAEARIARWILDCRRAQTDDATPLRTPETEALPLMPPTALPSPAVGPETGKLLPMEDIPLGAPYGGELPLWNSPPPIAEGKIATPLAKIPKEMTPHTAKLVLRLLEHVTRGAEALSAPMHIRRRRPQRCPVRVSHPETGSPGSYATAERRNFVERRIPLQSLAMANPACSQSAEEQRIRPAPPMRSPFVGAARCNRRKAS